MSDLYIIGGLFIAIYLLSLWLESKLPDNCHCDQAEQGRNCPNCTAPHLPKGNK